MISFLIPYASVEENRVRAFDLVWKDLLRDWPEEEILVGDGGIQPIGQFDRSKARNSLAAQAHGNPLVFVDADSWVAKEQLVRAVASIGLSGWVFPYSVYYSLSRTGTDEFIGGDMINMDYEYVFPGADPVDRPASVGGAVVVSRQAFEEVHGYDEEFQGWGFEDRAFALALETLCGPVKRIDGPLYHLWHPAPEEERFSQAHIEGNRAVYGAYQEAAGNTEMMRALVAQH